MGSESERELKTHRNSPVLSRPTRDATRIQRTLRYRLEDTQTYDLFLRGREVSNLEPEVVRSRVNGDGLEPAQRSLPEADPALFDRRDISRGVSVDEGELRKP